MHLLLQPLHLVRLRLAAHGRRAQRAQERPQQADGGAHERGELHRIVVPAISAGVAAEAQLPDGRGVAGWRRRGPGPGHSASAAAR